MPCPNAPCTGPQRPRLELHSSRAMGQTDPGRPFHNAPGKSGLGPYGRTRSARAVWAGMFGKSGLGRHIRQDRLGALRADTFGSGGLGRHERQERLGAVRADTFGNSGPGPSGRTRSAIAARTRPGGHVWLGRFWPARSARADTFGNSGSGPPGRTRLARAVLAGTFGKSGLAPSAWTRSARTVRAGTSGKIGLGPPRAHTFGKSGLAPSGRTGSAGARNERDLSCIGRGPWDEQILAAHSATSPSRDRQGPATSATGVALVAGRGTNRLWPPTPRRARHETGRGPQRARLAALIAGCGPLMAGLAVFRPVGREWLA